MANGDSISFNSKTLKAVGDLGSTTLISVMLAGVLYWQFTSQSDLFEKIGSQQKLQTEAIEKAVEVSELREQLMQRQTDLLERIANILDK